jgi:hemerythrin
MTWNPSLSIKVEALDEQHKTLVNMVNELHDAMKEGKGSQTLGDVLNSLVSYTDSHFADEVRLMEIHAYPDMAEHKEIHESLLKQVLELLKRFKSGRAILTLDVMMFLKDWLVTHIQGDDKKFGVFLNSKGVH